MSSIGEQPRNKIINEGTILTTCPHAQTSFMISMREFPVHPRIHREVQSSAKFVTLLSLIKLIFPVSSAVISMVSSPAFCHGSDSAVPLGRFISARTFGCKGSR